MSTENSEPTPIELPVCGKCGAEYEPHTQMFNSTLCVACATKKLAMQTAARHAMAQFETGETR